MSLFKEQEALQLKIAIVDIGRELFALHSELFLLSLNTDDFPEALNALIEKTNLLKEKAIVKYCESGMQQKEVAARFNMTPGRVCQIRKKHR